MGKPSGHAMFTHLRALSHLGVDDRLSPQEWKYAVLTNTLVEFRGLSRTTRSCGWRWTCAVVVKGKGEMETFFLLGERGKRRS